MEAKELMTGDWVLIKRTPSYEYPYKICSINNYSILGEDYADWIEVEADEEIKLEDIKPIPLTPEILEKNGFVRVGAGYRLKETYLTLSCSSRDDNPKVFWLGISDLECRVEYVHQLQHALRFCGLTEFADNFKVE